LGAPLAFRYHDGDIVVAVRNERDADLLPKTIVGMSVKTEIDIDLEPPIRLDLSNCKDLQSAIQEIERMANDGQI
jgi:hypothetical protein